MTRYDAIIVLGAAVWPDGRPSPALERRLQHAADLFKTGTAQYLLLTGGLGRHPPSEACVMQQLAVAAGVPASQIIIEDQSHSTFDSALSCAHILQEKGWKEALLVTDGYHLPRALFTFRALNIAVAGSAPSGNLLLRHNWKRWYTTYLREGMAFVWYGCRIVGRKMWQLRCFT